MFCFAFATKSIDNHESEKLYFNKFESSGCTVGITFYLSGFVILLPFDSHSCRRKPHIGKFPYKSNHQLKIENSKLVEVYKWECQLENYSRITSDLYWSENLFYQCSRCSIWLRQLKFPYVEFIWKRDMRNFHETHI